MSYIDHVQYFNLLSVWRIIVYNQLSFISSGAMNARDDKLRQFAYRASVADNVSRIGPAFGKTVGKYWYRDLIVQSWYDNFFSDNVNDNCAYISRFLVLYYSAVKCSFIRTDVIHLWNLSRLLSFLFVLPFLIYPSHARVSGACSTGPISEAYIGGGS